MLSKKRQNKLALWILVVLASVSSSFVTAQSSRLVAGEKTSDIPQYTVQIDVFKQWLDAVEYGFQLPFDATALGVGKLSVDGKTQYVLALGSFHSFDEAQQVIDDVCERYSLDNCRVRFLGRLDMIVDGDIAAAATVDSEVVLASTERDIPEITEGAVLVANATDSSQARGGLGAYTVQLAAMYEKVDAESTAKNVPAKFGQAMVSAISSGTGDIIYTVTVGQFDDIVDAREVATEACRELELYGCWVKPQ